MKAPLTALLMSNILIIGCGGGKSVEAERNRVNMQSLTTEEEAANNLYLDDVENSAADDQSTSTAEVDESVVEDCKEGRLQQMVAMVFKDLDADKSESLSLDEFLSGPAKRLENVKIDDAIKAKIAAKMTEDFNTFAGDDSLLSKDELTTLLKSVAPRVGRHRHMKFPGKHKERVKQTWEEITTKYDQDGDGLLNQAEYEALQADRREQDAKNQGRPQGPGPHGARRPPLPPLPFSGNGQ